ncbi:MAG: YceI family protein [Phenylobacterium sp.]|uniref:YceI family protein n=1 Tax=Phenylobacterium sp. TaxID=1871053 RepID=UPI002733B2FF|nr:YceI family protein [Phenylobacterium sp.]MDP3748389.1 YceI family protein [Phenylobacterium sp.]
MTRDRYSLVAIVLHWLIAAAIVFQLILGWRGHGLRTTLEGFSLIQLHKSVGVTILALSLARLAWRLTHRPPPEPETLAPWERRLAVATHWGFYVIMIGLPLSGWVVVSTSKITIPTLLYGVVPWPHVPGLAELAAPAKSAWNLVAYGVHKSLAWTAWGLLALHVAGALKHQLFSRDEPVLARMAPGAKAGRWLEPRLVAILLAAGAITTTGFLVSPPVPVSRLAPAAAPVAALTPATATPAPVAAPTVPGEPSRWAVAPGSTLGFATAFSGTPIEGRFQRWRADIVFDPDALDRSNVRVEIEVASADTGDSQRDEVLPSGDWFDAASHPKAVFAARRFRKTGTDRYVAEGELTLRGATKPLRLPFTLKIDGDTARLTGVTSLDRTAFGVGQGEWTNTDQIPAKVTISVDLTARRR